MKCFRMILLSILLQYNIGGTCGALGDDTEKGPGVLVVPSPMPSREEVLCKVQENTASCNPNNVFHSFDGSCNNLKYPYITLAKATFNRLLPPRYSDGISALRKASDGSELPLARVIRTTLLLEKEVFASNINMMCVALGQLVTHDVTFNKPISMVQPVNCCKNNKPDPNMPQEKCLPLIIPTDDVYYSRFQVTCIEQTRAINTQMLGCPLMPVTPINYATSMLDLSILYTTADDTASLLRTSQGGLLKTNNNELDCAFPEVISGENCPFGGLQRGPKGSCLHIGDVRVNQNAELISVSIIFMRMHNYIAIQLQKFNPHWSDEMLFQTARRINIAMYNIVVYKEQMPNLIGPDMCEWFGLNVAQNGYVNGYDEELDGRTLIEYAAAAGRALHSTVRGVVPYLDATGKATEYRLRDILFNNEFVLNKQTFVNLVTAYTTNQADDPDKYYNEEVANHGFIPLVDAYGHDLPAADINRGRDVGLATYNEIRELFGLGAYKSFDEMASDLKEPGDVEKLKILYKSIDDIDLYVGGILEKPMPGGLLGPTLGMIMGLSFQRWKYANRLYPEFQSAQFTPEQLDSIRQTTFSQLLCITNLGKEFVSRDSLLVPSQRNPEVKCADVPIIRLELWTEKQQQQSEQQPLSCPH